MEEVERPIVDIVLYNNERELLDLRIGILDEVVDKFYVKQATKTFQGEPKELLTEYPNPKVEIVTIDFPEDLDTWGRDRYQRAYKVDTSNIPDNAIMVTNDLDEVVNPECLRWLKSNFNPDLVYAFEQTMFQYYLNVVNRSEPWAGSRACSVAKYNEIDAETLRHMYKDITTILDAGWHWSFLGGKETIEKKIKSYAHAEYNSNYILEGIEERLNNNQDVFERGYRLETVELDHTFPEFILKNRDSLKHLIKS